MKLQPVESHERMDMNKNELRKIDKSNLIHQLIESLNLEFETLIQAAERAHEAATHDESKAEDKYDTRGLEASYLAGAQAQRAIEIKKIISSFKMLPTRPFSLMEPIDLGALIELKLNQKSFFYLFANLGGGKTISFNEQVIQVLTPLSPLGEELIGKKVGESVEIEAPNGVKEYLIIDIA